MSNTAELIFLGLPETGKTTYFVALDEVLIRQSPTHGLVSDGFATDRKYIEAAKKAWRAGKDVGRTNLMTTDEAVELRVRCAKTGASARLVAPDVNGEFFDDQWADRKWPVSYKDRIISAAGIYAFINASESGRNQEITGAWQNLSGAQEIPPKPWTARAAAKQVKVVDLLQVIAGVTRHPMPLVLMISAWDVIESESKPYMSPDDFLKKEWPLLYQFLQGNQHLFKSRVYGVSARGGCDADQKQLVARAPHERVWLKHGNEVTKDLTRPLRWLLQWD